MYMCSSVAGTMQDYNYAYHDTFEITLEISCCKFPGRDRLAVEWENNREALLTYIEQVIKKRPCADLESFVTGVGVQVQNPMSQ